MTSTATGTGHGLGLTEDEAPNQSQNSKGNSAKPIRTPAPVLPPPAHPSNAAALNRAYDRPGGANRFSACGLPGTSARGQLAFPLVRGAFTGPLSGRSAFCLEPKLSRPRGPGCLASCLCQPHPDRAAGARHWPARLRHLFLWIFRTRHTCNPVRAKGLRERQDVPPRGPTNLAASQGAQAGPTARPKHPVTAPWAPHPCRCPAGCASPMRVHRRNRLWSAGSE